MWREVEGGGRKMRGLEGVWWRAAEGARWRETEGDGGSWTELERGGKRQTVLYGSGGWRLPGREREVEGGGGRRNDMGRRGGEWRAVP